MKKITETSVENPILRLYGQYIKEMIFESPNIPESFLQIKIQPKIELRIDLDSKEVNNR